MSSAFYRRKNEHDRAMRGYGRGPDPNSRARREYMRDHAPNGSAAAPRKSVYAITERDGKSFWTKIGVGFPNADGSLNLVLDALPVNARLQVRDYEAPADDRDGGGEDGNAA